MHTELFTTQWYIKSHYQWQILYNENLFLHHKACCEARTQNSCFDILYTHVSVCSVEKCCIFYAPFLWHLFFSKFTLIVSIVFHKKSCEFRWQSLLQKLLHPILPFIYRQLFLYATPFQLCKVVVKYFYFEFIAIDTRHKTQMCMSHCWPVKGRRN